jgi:hypothetical protein
MRCPLCFPLKQGVALQGTVYVGYFRAFRADLGGGRFGAVVDFNAPVRMNDVLQSLTEMSAAAAQGRINRACATTPWIR